MASPIYGRLLQIVKPLGLRFFASQQGLGERWGKHGEATVSNAGCMMCTLCSVQLRSAQDSMKQIRAVRSLGRISAEDIL